MGIKTVYICDECGYQFDLSDEDEMEKIQGIFLVSVVNSPVGIFISLFDKYEAKKPMNKLMCGEDCLHKFISKNLTDINNTQSVSEPFKNLDKFIYGDKVNE